MIGLVATAVALTIGAPTSRQRTRAVSASATVRSQTAIVSRYLDAMRAGRYDAAYELLNRAERAYYRDPQNFASIYAADGYRVSAFRITSSRGDARMGRVFFVRETARFRDHAHDLNLIVTATVPVGVVSDGAQWRIKDPGHPWRAFAADASAAANGIRAVVKKVSFFERRIEVVVSFINTGSNFVTILPYGRSLLRNGSARSYRAIETRDWGLTDKTLFEGLRLAPDAQYTGTIAFACEPLRDAPTQLSLTLAPLLIDGGDAPFALDIETISAHPLTDESVAGGEATKP